MLTDTSMWGLWALHMASSAPVASLPSSHPGCSRDGKGSRWWGHGVLSPVPARLAKEWLGVKVPTLVLRRLHQAASERPLWGHPHSPPHSPSAQKLARQHPKAPDVSDWPAPKLEQSSVCPRRGAGGFWQRSGDRVVRRGLGSEILFSAPDSSLPTGSGPECGVRPGGDRDGPQSQVRDPEQASGSGVLASDSPEAWPWAVPCLSCLTGPHYSRVPAGLMGEAAPELSLPPAASFSFLPLYWPMKEPSSLNWTSTLPP